MDGLIIELTCAQAAWILAALGALVGIPMVAAPGRARASLASLPRSVPAAWIFTAIDLLWVTWIVYHAPLGRFEFLKPALFIATPVSFFLLITFMDDLLAIRSLGGLLLLAAYPLVRAAQWHDSPWRIAIVILAYGWVVAGMAYVLSPYLFRRWAAWWIASDARTRLAGILKLAGAALFAGIALHVA